jgi:hypothetical protein
MVEFFRKLYDRIGFRRNGVSWKNLHVRGLLSTQHMQYLLNEAVNIDGLQRGDKRNLICRFKPRFKNNDSLQTYLYYKDNILFETNYQLRGRTDILIDAFLLLDFTYVQDCKISLIRDNYNCMKSKKTVKRVIQY